MKPGEAQGGSPHLLPQRGLPSRPSVAAEYKVTLRPTVLSVGILEEIDPSELQVGLLVTPTTPEGHGHQELVCVGYARVALPLERRPGQQLAAFGKEILFSFEEPVTRIAQVALFCRHQLVAYGWPEPFGPLSHSVTTCRIRPGGLTLARAR